MQLSSSLTHALMTSLVLGLVTIATIVGNVFVIAAICLERHLRNNVANYLIASLAVADLFIAVLVMPLAVVNDVSSSWFLGPALCDVWVSFDVLCCTASILHLVAISLDRYWAVTRVDYIHNRSAKRILAMIAISWTLSTTISVPPLFGLRHSIVRPVHDDGRRESGPSTLNTTVWNGDSLFADTLSSSSSIPTNCFASPGNHDNNIASTHSSNVWNSRYPTARRQKTMIAVLLQMQLTTATNEMTSETWRCPHGGTMPTSGDASSLALNASTHLAVYDCLINQNIGYTIFSTVGAFYLPLAFITAVYLNVYRVARSRIHRNLFNNRKRQYERGMTTADPSSIEPEVESSLLRVFGRFRGRQSTSSFTSVQPSPSSAVEMVDPSPLIRHASSFNNGTTSGSRRYLSAPSGGTGLGRLSADIRCSSMNSSQHQLTVVQSPSPTPRYLSVDASPRLSDSISTLSTTSSSRGGSWIYLTREYFLDVLSRRSPMSTIGDNPSQLRQYRERRARGRRERKAARTLAVITGTFIVCWLPFFVVATIRPFCGSPCATAIPRSALSAVSWLGYGNSLLNPLIYTVFNPDFRRAFRHLLRIGHDPASVVAGSGNGRARPGVASGLSGGGMGGRSHGGDVSAAGGCSRRYDELSVSVQCDVTGPSTVAASRGLTSCGVEDKAE